MFVSFADIPLKPRRRRTRADALAAVTAAGEVLAAGPDATGEYWYSLRDMRRPGGRARARPWRLTLWRHGRADTWQRGYYASRAAALRRARTDELITRPLRPPERP